MLVAAGLPMRQLGLAAGVGATLVMLFAIFEPYRRARLTSFLDPWDHAAGAGFQAVQGQIAIGSGGLFGHGLGASIQKIFYVPEAHTDFILAVIGEELGLAGILALLSLYGIIGYAGLRTARNAKGAYAKLLAGGLTSLILCQALLNVYAVLGLAPLTGVPLPFISSGSTSLIVLLGAMGLLLNVAGGGSAHLRAVPEPRPRSSVSAPPRIVIAAGGTAGHVVPAIAVADALRAEGAEVSFVGGERAEAELVPKAGYELDTLNVEGLSRSNPLKAARAVGKAGARGRRRAQDPRRRAARTPCSAAAATSPGPVGLAARADRDPARARRGRLAPRPVQPRAGEPRAARLPRLPARGPRRRRATGSPAAPSRPR